MFDNHEATDASDTEISGEQSFLHASGCEEKMDDMVGSIYRQGNQGPAENNFFIYRDWYGVRSCIKCASRVFDSVKKTVMHKRSLN